MRHEKKSCKRRMCVYVGVHAMCSVDTCEFRVAQMRGIMMPCVESYFGRWRNASCRDSSNSYMLGSCTGAWAASYKL